MHEEKPVWAKQMSEAPFAKRHFTNRLAHGVLLRVSEAANPPRRRYKWGAAVMMLLIVVLVFGLAGAPNSVHVNVQEQNAYDQQGRLIFSVAPEPNAQAGVMNGYIFHFEEAMATFKGKTLTIQAVHLPTGHRETVSSEKIETASPGYPGLERYAIRFTLPLAGVWRLDVTLDDQPYGDVAVSMSDPSWEISPIFQSGNYWMRGLEKQVGFIDAGFIAGRTNKYMWHFWGTDEELDGPFQILAVREGSNTLIEVFSSNAFSSANALGQANNGADRHLPTSMMLPERGRWRLLPYVHGRLLNSIVVDVK
ncbi:DUF4871 domain-containing protein [Paenibacillus qinlingensis]|uniref:DUF4871 domain-containing protein n=1 Tax=Paenibacillus qinlingensis TaxID=1837343 RepID=A0ABU1NPB4_9BACL|nr:DUF4871 domain-containing protein [Paenibacillus qinlingensis]MDR6549214.1 hypothetical protein [Paenibacillus qinlingensis]